MTSLIFVSKLIIFLPKIPNIITHNNADTIHQKVEEITYFINNILFLAPLDSPTKVSVVKANSSIKN